MLLSFSVANFRSFREEQTLSMVAQKRFTDHPEHGISVPDTDLRVLPIAVFYGANGAGKSNLVKALRFAVQLVREGIAPGSPVPVQPFRLGGVEGQPSKFELRFVSEGKVFGYGFELNSDEVRAEWLDLYEGETACPLFEREATEGSPRLEVSPRLTADSRKVEALGIIGVRRNQLFLSAVSEFLEDEAQGHLLRDVFTWLGQVHSIETDASFEAFGALIGQDTQAREFVSQCLRDADTGVAGLQTLAVPIERHISEEERNTALAVLDADHSFTSVTLENGNEIFVSLGDDRKLITFDVQTLHKTSDGEVNMSFEDESDGTRRLAELTPTLRLFDYGSVLSIDEIDRSLHPILARKFIESFLTLNRGLPAQLIVTTHDTHLLDLELLRPDEVWFTEKDSEGATHIYPLADFPVRENAQLAKGYLQGRYGAIPFLGSLKNLIEKEAEKQLA